MSAAAPPGDGPRTALAQARPTLPGRHRSVWRAAWNARGELAGPRRLADEAAFLPAVLSLQETPVHPAPRRAAYAIMALFAIALAWSVLGQVDIVAVAPGRIVVSERTKLVQPLERSVVKRVLVKDGDRVAAGQPLVELDPTAATADKATVQEQVRTADAELLRARTMLEAMDRAPAGALPRGRFPTAWSSAEKDAAQAQLAAEWSDFIAKLSRMDAEAGHRQAEMGTVRAVIGKLESTLPLAGQREQDARSLADQGFAPQHMAQDRSRERLELERDLATQRARLAESQAALKESESARTAYLAETRRVLQDRQSQASFKRQQAAQEQTKVAQRERLTVLAAPVDGTVQQLAVHTGGGVVTEAQPLMVIVPGDAQVVAEVIIENKDVGFVHAGQAAEIKLETFLYTRYGTVHATVSRVAADAVNDEKRGAVFPATLALAGTHIDVDGTPIRLSPGMNLTAEIKTGRRTVAEYLFNPISKAARESLRER